jgi:hypothetical protein
MDVVGLRILSVTPKEKAQKGHGKKPGKNPMTCGYVFQGM